MAAASRQALEQELFSILQQHRRSCLLGRWGNPQLHERKLLQCIAGALQTLVPREEIVWQRAEHRDSPHTLLTYTAQLYEELEIVVQNQQFCIAAIGSEEARMGSRIVRSWLGYRRSSPASRDAGALVRSMYLPVIPEHMLWVRVSAAGQIQHHLHDLFHHEPQAWREIEHVLVEAFFVLHGRMSSMQAASG